MGNQVSGECCYDLMFYEVRTRGWAVPMVDYLL